MPKDISIPLIIKFKVLIALVLISFCFFNALPIAQGYQNPKVLVLNSYHQGFPWSDNLTNGIRSIIDFKDPDIDLHIEYMDTKRRSDELYFKELDELYKSKFKPDEFKVIIACDNDALDFLLKYRNALFPEIPVVFCGVNDFKDSLIDGQKNITGVVEETDIRATLDTILKLQPGTRQITVINDAIGTGLASKHILLSFIQDYADIDFRFLEGLDMSDVLKKVQDLPADSVVLLLPYNRDKSGNVISCKDYMLIANNSSVPIYGCWDCDLGNGIIGGMLTSGYAQGEMAAQIALRVLKGEQVSDIPVIKESPNRYMFDYKQMTHFNIKIADLPEGSIVINKESSFYEEHKNALWSAIASLSGFLMVIYILSANIIKRKRAEKELLQAKAELENKVAERTQELTKTVEELRQTQTVMRDREKLAIIGQMAAGMAHEIKNPLTAVKGFAQLLKEKYSKDETLSGYVKIILNEADQANKVITDFLQLARPKKPSLKVESIDNLINETLTIVGPKAYLEHIQVEYEGANALPVSLIDKDQIKQVLINLFHNAIDAMPKGGTIKISTGFLAAANEVYIKIQDTGCGVPEGKLSNLGVPFYTTKDNGTGLGLSISYTIIDAHNGRMEVESKEDQGTVFKIFLPKHDYPEKL